MGSLRILAASRIPFKGRVRSLPVEDDSPQHLLTPNKKLYRRIHSLTSIHLLSHHCCNALALYRMLPHRYCDIVKGSMMCATKLVGVRVEKHREGGQEAETRL